MKILIGVCMFAATVSQAAAELEFVPDDVPSHQILVRIRNGGFITPSILVPAKTVAVHILEQAGVTVRWGKTDSSEAPREINECGHQDLSVIDLAFLEHAPPSQQLFTLALAFPYASGGTRIHVFSDRILDGYRTRSPEFRSSLLGHVLAHEIGHILIGSRRHSDSGLMSAKWTGTELMGIASRPLPILQSDVEAIQRNLDIQAKPCPPLVMAARR